MSLLGSLPVSTDPAGASLVAAWLLLLCFYGWLAVLSSRKAVLTAQPFGLPDALYAGLLGLWMISIMAQGFHAPQQPITLGAIITNSILYGTLVFGVFGVIGFQKRSAIEVFQLQFSRFPKAAITGLLGLAIIYPLIVLTQSLVQHFTGSQDDTQLIIRYFLEHPDLHHRAAVILMAVIVAPVSEEIIFRGYFYGILRRYGGRIPAILTSSLLFAAIHVHLPSAPGLFLLAVALCLVYERSGSLWANITLHAAFNTTTIATLIFWPQLAS